MTEPWVTELRKRIKRRFWKGIGIEPQSGKVKLVIRELESGKYSRKLVTLDIPWSVESEERIIPAIAEILEDQKKIKGCTLQKAAERYRKRKEKGITTERDWSAIAEEFKHKRMQGKASSTQVNFNRRVNRFLEALEKKPYPDDFKSLLNRYEKIFFSHMESGGDGRVKDLQVVVQILEYGVKNCGKDPKWLPDLNRTDREEVIGVEPRNTQERLTPPLKPADLIWLLNCMEKDGKHDLRLATGIVGFYGIRPSELATLKIEDGILLCRGTKRNRRGGGDNRELLALDVAGHPGLGKYFLDQYRLGLKTKEGIKLPISVRNEIEKVKIKNKYQDVGRAYRQLLERYGPWKSLVEENPGLTPYSLRHGWAWRAHRGSERPMPLSDAANYMGHSPKVHMNEYGSFSDTLARRRAGEEFNKNLVQA